MIVTIVNKSGAESSVDVDEEMAAYLRTLGDRGEFESVTVDGDPQPGGDTLPGTTRERTLRRRGDDPAAARQRGPALEPSDTEPADPDAEPSDGRPRVNDPKADWVAYAVTMGADEAEAEATNKADLIAVYGDAEGSEGSEGGEG